MTTTYELYTNENGTPKAVEGKAPAILERVETLETSVETIEETLDNGVVTSVNGHTGDVTVDVGVTSVNGNTGDIKPEQTGCLPLSGGTMTGAIALRKGDNSLVAPSDDSYIEIEGGTAFGKGASLTLYGKDNATPGCFKLFANAGSGHVMLLGKPDGYLTWDGKEVERLNSFSASDNVGYIRYENGLQICWAKSVVGTVTFPAPFADNPSITVSYWTSKATGGLPRFPWVGKPSVTGFVTNTCELDGTKTVANTDLSYTAIGYWK